MPPILNVFHPDLSRSRVTSAWARAAERQGAIVRLIGESWDVPEEQAAAEGADALIFIHPFHWYSGPWILKRWIDEVLSYGWAYGGPDRLAGKRWVHAISVGAPESEYGRTGSRVYEVKEFLRPFERTAAFCRADWQRPFLSHGSGIASAEQIAASAARFESWLVEGYLSPPAGLNPAQ